MDIPIAFDLSPSDRSMESLYIIFDEMLLLLFIVMFYNLHAKKNHEIYRHLLEKKDEI